MNNKSPLNSFRRLCPLLLLLALPGKALSQVLVQDVFNGSGGALPDAVKYVWSGQLGQYGTGLLYLSTDAVDESWLRSIAGAAPSAGQTLDLQMRVYAYAENWTPGVYGDGQPRGLRVGNDANNVVEFYSLSHYSVGLRLRKDGVETLASYDLPSGVDIQHDYEIAVTITSVVFKVDGIIAGTFTNNIPTGELNFYADSWDGGGVGNVPIGIASLFLNLISPPVITGFAPASGPNGTSVVISGTNFCGITNVQFDGMAAPFTNNSATLITAIVPAGATNGLFTVFSTNGIATSSNNFVVTPRVFNYTTNAGTITITGYIGSGGAVAIPDTIYGLPVLGISDSSFAVNASLTSITIPDSVTFIGTRSFYFCTSLTNVTIGNSVTTIGYMAFSSCSGLTSVTIGNSVTNIGVNAFSSCSGLKSMTIPNSVTKINDGVFSHCSGLTNVTIGNGVTTIGWYVFDYCSSLKMIAVDVTNSVYSSMDGVLLNKSQTTLITCPGGKAGNYTVSNSVNTIGRAAFYCCSGLTSVTVPNSVTTIGDQAFYNCSGLTNVTIGNGVTTIGWYVFDYCSSLKMIAVDVTNSVYSSRDGVLLNKSQTTLITCPAGKAGNYTIPNGVITIGDSAFYNCSGLTSVTIPNSVTTINDGAFRYCYGLTCVSISNSVTNIGYSAFYNCSGLTNVTIGNSVTTIGDYAFCLCSSLSRIYFCGNAPSLGGSSVLSGSICTVYRLAIAAGWPPVPDLWAGRPTVLWNLAPHMPTDSCGVVSNRFGFAINWQGMQGNVVVEACTNLASPDWIPVATHTLTNGTAYFSDCEWTNHPGRFYRLRSP